MPPIYNIRPPHARSKEGRGVTSRHPTSSLVGWLKAGPWSVGGREAVARRQVQVGADPCESLVHQGEVECSV
eukprot:scaffold83119_cov31-Tisochrysis_lutea.AAC.5